MTAQRWAERLLDHVRRDFQGNQCSHNRVSIENHTFVSAKMNGTHVLVEVGDLDSATVDFQPFEFNPEAITVEDAVRDIEPFIRCIQWL